MRATPSRRTSAFRAADFTSPLTIPGGEVAGAHVVRELPAEVALTVWQVLRSVLLWAAEIPAQRGDLFERRAMEDWERELLEGTFDVDLRYPLAVIVGELADPEAASPEQLAHACLCVAEWSLARRATRTALGFSEAAALCWPDHPRYAWMVGRLLRTHGYLREAEQWIKRSVRVAGNTGDWETQTLALNSLGNLLYESGKYPESVRTLEDALRASRKHHLRAQEGEILHDLFAVTMWGGDVARAEGLAQAAYDIYRTGHHRLPALAHDVAVLWIKREQFERAFTVLKELPAFFEHHPEERIRVLASLARTAGACGDQVVFLQACGEAEALAEDPYVSIRSAPAMLEIGLGAWDLRAWDTAERALETAIRLAVMAGEADVRVQAEAILDAVRERSCPQSERKPVTSRAAVASDALASGFLTSLQTVGLSAVGV
jgi:tetratricopeptide (TPR) repeat protein